MYDVKCYAFTLLCCSAACRIIDFISPDNCKKQMSTIIGIVMLLCILSPLKNIGDFKPNINDYVFETNTYNINSEELIAEQFKNELSKIIIDKLGASGIFTDDIRIEMKITDQQLFVDEITVVITKDSDVNIREIRDALKEYLKLDVNVVYGGGQNTDGG